jgi:hypothetical protein
LNAERSEAIEQHEVLLEFLIAAAQRSIPLSSIS